MTAPPSFHSRQQCAVCRELLTVHQAVRGGLCDRAHCRREGLRRELAARRAKAEAEIHASAVQHRDQVAAQLLPRARAPIIALIPASTQHASLLPASRRRQFREHLVSLLNNLAQIPPPARTPLPAEEQPGNAQFAAESTILSAGCATCRGRCCNAGDVKAFIDEQTLQRFGEAHPSLGAQDIVRAYSSHLPRRSVQNSCVFHGERGCALPRNMRSTICNTYHCDGLQQLAVTRARRILITATNEHGVVRSALFEQGRIMATFDPVAATARSKPRSKPRQ